MILSQHQSIAFAILIWMKLMITSSINKAKQESDFGWKKVAHFHICIISTVLSRSIHVSLACIWQKHGMNVQIKTKYYWKYFIIIIFDRKLYSTSDVWWYEYKLRNQIWHAHFSFVFFYYITFSRSILKLIRDGG